MSNKPLIFQVSKEQVGKQDINEFLRTALAREFNGKEYMIVHETTLDSPTPYSREFRRLKGYNIEVAGKTHTIYFDITDAQSINKDKNSWKFF